MDRKRIRSSISRSLTVKYFISILLLVLFFVGGYFLSWLFLSRFTWRSGDALYSVFKVLQYMSPYIIVLGSLIGVVLITRHFFMIPLNYVDSLVEAASKLAVSRHEAVSLPDALKDTENQLNLIREQSIRSEFAAKEAEQRKNDLIMYLAHDLKTPLTSVIGYLGLLREAPELQPEQRARYTGIAYDKALRLEELIDEFFDITRFSLSSIELVMQRIDLSLMLNQICAEFGPMLLEKRLRFIMKVPPGEYIVCDPDKLERVFDNLLRNAINYAYEGSDIEIRLWLEDKNAVICISNKGRTIPPEMLNRLFEQFFRLDASRSSSSGGSGLGLAIAKGIVDLHGGRICADSRDETVSFTVRLPAADIKDPASKM